MYIVHTKNKVNLDEAQEDHNAPEEHIKRREHCGESRNTRGAQRVSAPFSTRQQIAGAPTEAAAVDKPHVESKVEGLVRNTRTYHVA